MQCMPTLCHTNYHTICLSQVDWKPANVTTLICHLKAVVDQQYTELCRSLAKLGDLQLTPAFASRHLTSQLRWNAMSEEAKKKSFEKLMKDTGKPC